VTRFGDPEPLGRGHDVADLVCGVASLAAAESAGIRVLLVHAIDDDARRFYERHGFEASPTDPRNLQMLMKDLRASAEAAGP
jgi:hypothetical protein